MTPLSSIDIARQEKGTRIFTFYSFKGGVGRSMAVINVAALLAREGRRVLIIDLDLEAPGITYLAEEAVRSQPPPPAQPELLSPPQRFGFVDALYDLITKGTASPLGNKDEANPFANYIRPLDVTDFAQAELEEGERIQVDLMPAGNLDDPPSEYRRRLSQLALEERFKYGDAIPLLQHFKTLLLRIRPPYDYVLVDSRTGLSAEASAAVGYLADHLIILMGLNLQNRQGTAQFLRILRDGKLRPQSLSLVISPMPIGEDELADQHLAEAENAITNAWDSKKPIKAVALIPYHPRIALDERPHRRRRTNEHLSSAYARLASRISELKGQAAAQLFLGLINAVIMDNWTKAATYLSYLPRGKNEEPLTFLRNFSPLHQVLGKPEVQPVIAALERFVPQNGDAAYLSALHFSRAKEMASAEATWKLYLDRKPTREHRWMEAAKFWQEDAKDPERARDVYEQALTKLPYSAKLWHAAALFYLKAFGDLDSAERHFRTALELDPENATAYANYATFLWRERRQVEEAEQHYRRALELDPENATAHGNYANFLFQERRQVEEAEQHYRRVLELDPENATAHANYATFLCDERRQLEEAEQHYRRALELDPKDATAHGNYATFLWEERRQLEEAEQHYRRALELDPKDASAHTNYASFLRKERGQLEEVEQHYRRALELDPKDATAHGNYANFLWEERRQLEEAEQHYRRALELDTKDTFIRHNSRELFLVMGRFDEVRQELQRSWPDELGGNVNRCLVTLLHAGLLCCLAGGAEERILGKAAYIFQHGFKTDNSRYDALLAALKPRLHAEDFTFYSQFAAVLTGKANVETLNGFPRWRKVKPLPLEGPLFETESAPPPGSPPN
jgi:Tfp pilus assembly protein PilF/cellulose biosynthesis protein BcsQ